MRGVLLGIGAGHSDVAAARQKAVVMGQDLQRAAHTDAADGHDGCLARAEGREPVAHAQLKPLLAKLKRTAKAAGLGGRELQCVLRIGPYSCCCLLSVGHCSCQCAWSQIDAENSCALPPAPQRDGQTSVVACDIRCAELLILLHGAENEALDATQPSRERAEERPARPADHEEQCCREHRLRTSAGRHRCASAPRLSSESTGRSERPRDSPMGPADDDALDEAAPCSLLLPAAALRPRASWLRPTDRRNVVLLHGWLQDHACWLPTAHALRARYGHDVLLLDWPGHGCSARPEDAEDMHVDALVSELRRILVRVGWAGGAAARRPLTIGGCSLGGAVSMKYVTAHPGEVERLVLVAPAGFDEPWHRVSVHAGRLTAAAITSATRRVRALRHVLPHGLRAHARLVSETPRYGNLVDWFASDVARRTPTLLVCATFDGLHHADAWAAPREGDPSFRLIRLPLTHPMLCAAIPWLRLEEDALAWHGGTERGALPASPRPGGGSTTPRARL